MAAWHYRSSLGNQRHCGIAGFKMTHCRVTLLNEKKPVEARSFPENGKAGDCTTPGEIVGPSMLKCLPLLLGMRLLICSGPVA
jgi:hypothetical protein